MSVLINDTQFNLLSGYANPLAIIGTGEPLGRIIGTSGQFFWATDDKSLWFKESGNYNSTGWYQIYRGN